MSSLPIDNMPAAELAIHLMTSGFSLSGGEPEARRLLAELRSAALHEAADFVGNDDDCDCGGCDTCHPNKLAAELRAMADASRRTS